MTARAHNRRLRDLTTYALYQRPFSVRSLSVVLGLSPGAVSAILHRLSVESGHPLNHASACARAEWATLRLFDLYTLRTARRRRPDRTPG